MDIDEIRSRVKIFWNQMEVVNFYAKYDIIVQHSGTLEVTMVHVLGSVGQFIVSPLRAHTFEKRWYGLNFLEMDVAVGLSRHFPSMRAHSLSDIFFDAHDTALIRLLFSED